jgi:AraC-like DNA-binding protein
LLQEGSSVGDFLANPIGRYYRGRRHAVFAQSPTLLGFVAWGRPDVDDVRELLRLCEVGLKPGVVPHRWLVDVRGLELVEAGTFGLFLEYTRKNRETLRQNIVRQAQLRPDGLVGAIISGFSHLAKLSYPERVFGDVEEALAWLEIDAQQGIELLAQLDAIRNQACESYAVVGRLRRELEVAGILAVEDAALRLGLSTRSFQRALRQAGTTYRMELKAYRMRRAQDLLRQGDRNLTWIAAEVGFSSVQHFATAYRRAIGDTPSAWRARHRDETK